MELNRFSKKYTDKKFDNEKEKSINVFITYM